MDTTPSLERLSATNGELAGMLTTAGCRPTANSPLPEPGPAGQLTPTPDQETLLWVAANPTGALRIVGPGRDRGTGITTSLLWDDPRGPFVIATPTDTGFDLAMLLNRSMALSWLDRALSLTTLPSPASTQRHDLDLPAYAALLALADAVTEIRLRERLERKQRRLGGITIDQLRGALQNGLHSTDDRWAVSGARMVCPADLAQAARHLDRGVVRLVDLGLVTGDPSSVGIAHAGATFVSALATEPRSTGLAAAVATETGIDASHLTVHRSPIALLVGVWKALGDEPWLSLSQPSAARFLDLLDGLIVGR